MKQILNLPWHCHFFCLQSNKSLLWQHVGALWEVPATGWKQQIVQLNSHFCPQFRLVLDRLLKKKKNNKKQPAESPQEALRFHSLINSCWSFNLTAAGTKKVLFSNFHSMKKNFGFFLLLLLSKLTLSNPALPLPAKKDIVKRCLQHPIYLGSNWMAGAGEHKTGLALSFWGESFRKIHFQCVCCWENSWNSINWCFWGSSGTSSAAKSIQTHPASTPLEIPWVRALRKGEKNLHFKFHLPLCSHLQPARNSQVGLWSSQVSLSSSQVGLSKFPVLFVSSSDRSCLMHSGHYKMLIKIPMLCTFHIPR